MKKCKLCKICRPDYVIRKANYAINNVNCDFFLSNFKVFDLDVYIYQLFRLVNLNKGRVGVTSIGNSLRLRLAPDMQNNALNFKCLRNQRWQRFFNLLVDLCFILWIFWVLLWIMRFFMNCAIGCDLRSIVQNHTIA